MKQIWIRIPLTRRDASLPLEGDGTIWQLSDGTVEESRTVENYSHFEECKAKEIIESPPSGVHVMKSDWNDCSQGAEAATWLSSRGEKSLHSMSKLSDDWGQRDCGRFCNSINSHGSVFCCRFFDFNSSLLDCRKSWATCASDSLNVRVKPKRIQEASSLRRTLNNIKTTTAIQRVISTAFHEGTNKKNRPTQRFWLFQVEWSVGGS